MKSTIIVKGSIRDDYRTEIVSSHNCVLDQSTPAGGDGDGSSPLEFFLRSLAGCFCALGKIISDRKKLNIKEMDVKIEGDTNADYLLGKRTITGGTGFTEIRSYISIDGDMTEKEKNEFLKEIERKCPIADNIISNTKLITKIVKHQSMRIAEAAYA